MYVWRSYRTTIEIYGNDATTELTELPISSDETALHAQIYPPVRGVCDITHASTDARESVTCVSGGAFAWAIVAEIPSKGKLAFAARAAVGVLVFGRCRVSGRIF